MDHFDFACIYYIKTKFRYAYDISYMDHIRLYTVYSL